MCVFHLVVFLSLNAVQQHNTTMIQIYKSVSKSGRICSMIYDVSYDHALSNNQKAFSMYVACIYIRILFTLEENWPRKSTF